MMYLVEWLVLVGACIYVAWYVEESAGAIPRFLCSHKSEHGEVIAGQWMFQCLRCKRVSNGSADKDAAISVHGADV